MADQTTQQTRYSIADYMADAEEPPFVRLVVKPSFTPVDINLLFLSRQGWAQGDRLRIAIAPPSTALSGPMAAIIGRIPPHVLIRRYDRDEDAFASLRFLMDGRVIVESNDLDFAHRYMRGALLECPPSFHSAADIDVEETWVSDPTERAMFLGMLSGALGWDPSHQVPPAIAESLEEARRSFEVANYRSCVAMCRRLVEALLKFAHERLLKAKPLDRKGRHLMLNGLIKRFQQEKPPPIPLHLLHVVDALRVLGNVPGAHPADIQNYQFTSTDAEFALGVAHYVIDQYFAKIDQDVTTIYTVTIEQ